MLETIITVSSQIVYLKLECSQIKSCFSQPRLTQVISHRQGTDCCLVMEYSQLQDLLSQGNIRAVSSNHCS